MLDRALRTRGHVRTLRALAKVDPSINLSVRGLAKLAGISHVQTGRTVFELERAGLVSVRRVEG